ncbi:MAG: phosphatase PAP2 family protein [Bacteroidales bacterium]|nr:phosphatase PAP2 family protein [Bacteroidales bacterium]
MYLKSQVFKHFSWVFIALLLLSSPLLFSEKSFLNIWLNQHHSFVLDQFFKYITYLGNGWVLLFVLVFALSRNYFLSLVFVLSVLFEFLLVQIVLKHGFFADIVRPIKYMAHSDLLHKVPGVDISTLHSFPSGHTQTAFLVFAFLSLFCKRRFWAYLLLFFAVSVALSRVYLLQHFFIDVWFGALIGYLFLVIIHLLFNKYSHLSSHPKWGRGFLVKKQN